VSNGIYKRLGPVFTGILRLPDIGFMSKARRLSAFFVACEIFEKLIDEEVLDFDGVLLAITVLKLQHRPFKKAAIMFEIMVRQDRIGLATFAAEGGRVALSYGKNFNPSL
jgi:hypothetical protein